MVLARVLHVRQDVTPTYPSTRITKQCESETKPSMHRLDTFSISAQVDYRYVLDLKFCVDLENDIRFHLRSRFWPFSKYVDPETALHFCPTAKRLSYLESA